MICKSWWLFSRELSETEEKKVKSLMCHRLSLLHQKKRIFKVPLGALLLTNNHPLPLVSLTHRSRHSSTLYHQSRLAQVLRLRFAGARNPILVLCVEMTEKASIDDVIVNVTEIEIRTKTVISIVNDRANA